MKSWGEPGNAKDLRNSTNEPGLFHTPHGIWVEGDRVYVLDRENNRIQVYTTDGEFVTMWINLERPTDMCVDREGVAYISELEDHVSIRDLNGNEIGRFGSERSNAPGKFWGPHCIWVDSQGDMYVGEVLEGQRRKSSSAQDRNLPFRRGRPPTSAGRSAVLGPRCVLWRW